MHTSQAFPSKYLKASDLQDQPVRVIMDRTEMHDLGDDEPKPVLYFQRAEFDWLPKKPMVVNKTNWNAIADIYDNESDEWIGKELVLYPAMVDFKGKSTPAIRVRGPKPKNSAANRGNGVPPRPTIRTELNDEVPF